MEVTVIETNKGHKSILCEGFRYRLDVETKSGDLSWRCSANGCKARVRTDAGPSLVIQQKNDHKHDPDDRGNERHVLRVNAKRKAIDDFSARPSKVIRSELQTMNEKSLEPKDLKCVAKAVYIRRRKTYPRHSKKHTRI
jgi:hypothetical protein